VKSEKEPVTVVTLVTPYRRVYPLKIVDDSSSKNDINVLDFLKNCGKSNQCSILEWCDSEKEGRYTLPYAVTSVTSVTRIGDYTIIPAYPATGILYIINNFLSGQIRMRGTGGGAYPANYLEFIDNVFGPEPNTIEVCSGSVKDCFTVDINPDVRPSILGDGQELGGIKDNTFSRWRCDPPYNEDTARKMYNCELPSLSKLLSAGARVVKPNSLMFLLCSQNREICPSNLKRIGFIYISVVPNNETRILNIYVKLDEK
jgi:hypothetical protein